MFGSGTLVVVGILVLFGLFMATLAWGQYYSRNAGTFAEQKKEAP